MGPLRAYRLEVMFGLLVVCFLAALAGGAILAQLLLAAALIVTLGMLLIRWGRRLLKPLIWRLRNRLIVAYLFIVAIPMLLLLALTATTVRYIGGQVAVYLVQTEFDRRVAALNDTAWMLVQAPVTDQAKLAETVRTSAADRFPGIQIELGEGRDVEPVKWKTSAGLVVRDRKLYVWSRAISKERQGTVLVPITRRWLAQLVPGVGAVSVLSDETPRRPLQFHGDDDDDAGVPPAANRYDLEILWGNNVRLDVWDRPGRRESAILGVHSRVSALLRVLTAKEGRVSIPNLIWVYVVLLALVEVISIYLGISITRTITGAVHDLYEGTQRVMTGDFAHRIPLRGDDQITELGRSFNQMTENVERLLRVAKENERLQAELEIARQVQSQLFPRETPVLQSLELKAMCHAARMVSGDYYDYQALGEGRVAIALGDVAGKGVSAALLMASLQACLRMQLREMAAGDIACVMSRINLQLHASTAPEKYATFFLAVYDDRTGEFTFSNAGHLAPVLIREGRARLLDVQSANGMVVGAFPFAQYGQGRLVLEPGDLLVGYTDGITEPENEFGEMFGEQRLMDVLVTCAHLDSDKIMQAVVEAVHKFTGSPELQDDMTLMVARRH